MATFDPETYYRPDDPALRIIGAETTLRVWRCKGRGPAYHKVGGKVLYRGAELNAYLDSCIIRPTAA